MPAETDPPKLAMPPVRPEGSAEGATTENSELEREAEEIQMLTQTVGLDELKARLRLKDDEFRKLGELTLDDIFSELRMKPRRALFREITLLKKAVEHQERQRVAAVPGKFNPFPEGTRPHEVFRNMMLLVKEDASFLASDQAAKMPPEGASQQEFLKWILDAIGGLFDIWIRALSKDMALTDDAADGFEALSEATEKYLTAQFDSLRFTFIPQRLLAGEIKLRLFERKHYWNGEARRRVRENKEAIRANSSVASGDTEQQAASTCTDEVAQRAKVRQTFLAPFLKTRSLNALAVECDIEYSSLHRWQDGKSSKLSPENRGKLAEQTKTKVDLIPV